MQNDIFKRQTLAVVSTSAHFYCICSKMMFLAWLHSASRESFRAEVRHSAHRQLALQGLISHAEVLEQELNQRGSPTDAGHAADSLSSSPPNGAAPFSRQGSTPSQQHLPSRGSRSLQLLHWDDRKSHDGLEDQGLVLYEHGQLSDVFTLLLQGKACIRTGRQLVSSALLCAACESQQAMRAGAGASFSMLVSCARSICCWH